MVQAVFVCLTFLLTLEALGAVLRLAGVDLPWPPP